jgi:DNA-binding NarL/FixJ family response regulator
MIRVFIVIEVCLYRCGVADILRRPDGFEVLGAAPDLDSCLAEVARERPDVVLLDAATPDGPPALRRLAVAWPDVRVLVMGVREVETDVMRWVEAGAAGYISRNASVEDLKAALRRAARGEAVLPPRIAACLMRELAVLSAGRRQAQSEVWNLTAREEEVVELLRGGLSNAQIAARLQIELPTVKNHVHHILKKVGVERRDEVASRVGFLAGSSPR